VFGEYCFVRGNLVSQLDQDRILINADCTLREAGEDAVCACATAEEEHRCHAGSMSFYQ
jgi:hypothetical protein